MKIDKNLLFEKLEGPLKHNLIVLGILTVISYIISFVLYKFSTARKVLDKKLTEKVKTIVNEDVIVFKVKDDSINAMNAGTKRLYYASGCRKYLTEPEIISLLLHEFGHYKEKHFFKRVTVYINEKNGHKMQRIVFQQGEIWWDFTNSSFSRSRVHRGFLFFPVGLVGLFSR